MSEIDLIIDFEPPDVPEYADNYFEYNLLCHALDAIGLILKKWKK